MSETATSQLTRALDAVARTEDKVHAYRHLLEQEARSSSVDADKTGTQSPIFGWPFAVKEVFDVAGVVTAGGSQAYQDRVATSDATAVARLRAAGSTLVGTQIAHELTCGLDQPPTRNPWDLSCYPGGSSAGAGVSVAVGSARFALGTDAAGSVRIPAAMTGTTGLKPTWGLISSHGVMREASAPSIDHVGIIARSAEEVARVLPILAGPDPWDASTLQARGHHEQNPPHTDRIAVLGEATLGALSDTCPLDPDIKRAFSASCDTFRRSGAEIVEIELPTLPMAVGAIVTFFSAELACANAAMLEKHRDRFTPTVADMIETGLEIPADRLMEAVRVRSQLKAELSAAFAAANTQFLLTPTTPRPAMPLANFDPTEELGTLIPFTCGFNLTGNPAISLPCGQTKDGLPIGLQIVARPFRETGLLDLATEFQRRTHWHEMRPPV
ncbi:amidase [Roseibium sp. HPY-6]|uniref:amidase n=1 Tax=Roseibium sp. HPY-6 TaxID=3229852 RepID=UPI00338DDE94